MQYHDKLDHIITALDCIHISNIWSVSHIPAAVFDLKLTLNLLLHDTEWLMPFSIQGCLSSSRMGMRRLGSTWSMSLRIWMLSAESHLGMSYLPLWNQHTYSYQCLLSTSGRAWSWPVREDIALCNICCQWPRPCSAKDRKWPPKTTLKYYHLTHCSLNSLRICKGLQDISHIVQASIWPISMA